MAIEFVCPACRESLRVADEAAGSVVRCGSCLATLRVPASPAASGLPHAEPAPPPRRPAAEPIAPAPAPHDADDHGEPRPRRRRAPAGGRSGRSVLFWLLVIAFVLVTSLTARLLLVRYRKKLEG